MRRLSDEQKRKMAEGRRLKKENIAKEAKERCEYSIAKMEFNRDLALHLHGALFRIKPFSKDKIKQWIQWYKERPTNHPAFIAELNEETDYYLVYDLASCPEHDGLPICACAGWVRPFTKEQADAFIKKHEPNLRTLKREQLVVYLGRNNRDERLRFMFYLDFAPANWREWFAKQRAEKLGGSA